VYGSFGSMWTVYGVGSSLAESSSVDALVSVAVSVGSSVARSVVSADSPLPVQPASVVASRPALPASIWRRRAM